MIYSIVGNLIGTNYDGINIINSFDKGISEDTILICGTIESILTNRPLNLSIKKWNNKYPNIKCGYNFENWIKTNIPYDSFGNLGIIKTIPYIYYYKNYDEVLKYSLLNLKSSHINDESIKSCECLIRCLWLAKNKVSKKEIYLEMLNFYDIKFHLIDIKDSYKYEPTCQNTIPYCIVAFLESNNYEDSLEKILSIGGDIKTNCTIVSAIASLYYDNIDIKFNNLFIEHINEDIYLLIKKFIDKC